MIKLKTLKVYQCICFVSILLTSFPSTGQSKQSNMVNNTKNLFEEISKMDSLLFSAFNSGDIEMYSSLISEDIQFYHDKNGLVDSKKRVMESFKNMVASKRDLTHSITRKLVKNTLEVYEIPEFGAVQIGVHQFLETDGNKKDKVTTQAKFVHLWKMENGSWTLHNVYSYDHTPVKQKINSDAKLIQLSDAKMDSYLGKYQFSPEFVLTIIREGNTMYGLAQGDKIKIKPYAEHKFLVTTDNSKIEFTVGKDNTINGMVMETKGGEMQAEKIK